MANEYVMLWGVVESVTANVISFLLGARVALHDLGVAMHTCKESHVDRIDGRSNIVMQCN